MNRFFSTLLFLFFVHAGFAAPPPDWIKTGIAAGPGNWSKQPAVIIQRDRLARFNTEEKVTEKVRLLLYVGTASGRSQAVFGEFYNPGTEKILNASAWVIGKDGKVQRQYKRADYIEDFVTYDHVMWDNSRSLSLDLGNQVDIGGYVAFEIEKISTSPIFEVSHFLIDELPLVSDTLEVIPPASAPLQWFSTVTPQLTPLAGSEPGSLRWAIGRTERAVEDAPDGYFRNMRAIFVRCARSAGGEMDQSSWSSLATAVSGIFNPMLAADASVRAKALELTAGKTDRWSRIRALCEFAQRDIRYIQITLDTDYLAGYRPHPPADILKNRYGDCKDKAALLVAMLTAIGERSHMIVVNSGNPLAVIQEWSSTNWFNHVIVGIDAGDDAPGGWPLTDAGALGKFVVFDPTNPVAPLGVLALEDQGGFGLLAAPKDGGLVSLPRDEPAQNSIVLTINAKLDPDLLLKAHVNTVRQGSGASEGYFERLESGDAAFARGLEAGLHDSLARVDNFSWSDSWDGVLARHTIDTRFSSTSYPKPLGRDRAVIQPGIVLMDFALRKMAVTDGLVPFAASSLKQTVTLRIPSTWSVSDLPKPVRHDGKYLAWDIQCSSTEGRLVYSVTVLRKHALADGGLYEEIRRERQQLHELLRRPAILKWTPTPAPKKAAE